MSSFPIIGFREWVVLTEWGVGPLRAKADTGAKTSAIDVAAIRERANGSVEFDIALHSKQRDRIVTVESTITRTNVVRSSTGEEQERIFVKTPVQVGEVMADIEISLVNRKGMIYRMLLGREALIGRFLVDSSSVHLLGKPAEQRSAK